MRVVRFESADHPDGEPVANTDAADGAANPEMYRAWASVLRGIRADRRDPHAPRQPRPGEWPAPLPSTVTRGQ
jgi:hypothetical protein